MIIAISIGVVALLLLVFAPRAYRRWDESRRAAGAPSEPEQDRIVTALFDGRPLATLDPRNFTIAVGRMNAIANSFGYYYIGEKGTIYGSTEVAFQRLPFPPPLPVPRKSASWAPYMPPTN